jgi:hypothetical protein
MTTLASETVHAIPFQIRDDCERWSTEFIKILRALPRLRREAAVAAKATTTMPADDARSATAIRARQAAEDLSAAERAYEVISRIYAGTAVRLGKAAPVSAVNIAHDILTGPIQHWSSDIKALPIPAAPLFMRAAQWLAPAAVLAGAYAYVPLPLVLVAVPVALVVWNWISSRVNEQLIKIAAAQRDQVALVERLESLSRLIGLPRSHLVR